MEEEKKVAESLQDNAPESPTQEIEISEMNENEVQLEKANKEYTATNIQVLEGLEAVRKRPGMYIGTTSAAGLHHLVWEIVDNAIDEALAGYCTEVNVFINKGDTITVIDNGRGIPVDVVAKSGLSGVETVYTVLHAGGKFGEGGGYKVSGGLHGVGASVVNALSEWCEVTVNKDGGVYYIKFVNGGHIVEHLKRIGDERFGRGHFFLIWSCYSDRPFLKHADFFFFTFVVQHRYRVDDCEFAFLDAGDFSLDAIRNHYLVKDY